MNPSNGRYLEAQTPPTKEGEENVSTSRIKRLAWATALSIAAIVVYENADSVSEHFRSVPTSSKHIGRQYKDEEHAAILAGDEEAIGKLGGLDHPSFHGREKKIYDDLFSVLYLAKHLPKTDEQLDLELMAEIRTVIASHEAEVLWLWMDYVERIQEYCQNNPTPNAKGEMVPTYFENVPYLTQRQLLRKSAKEVGLDLIIENAVLKEISARENAQDEPRENADIIMPKYKYNHAPFAPFPLAP